MRGETRTLLLASDSSFYGAGRMLLTSVGALVGAGHDVLVVFPCTGPLVDRVRQAGADTIVLPDFALRRKSLRPSQLPSLARRQLEAVRWIRVEHHRAAFDLIYSNTQSVTIGPVLQRMLKIPHLWHVHEIFARPRWMARLLALAALHGAERVVCISRSVEAHLLDLAPGLISRTTVILNGIDLTEMSQIDLPAPSSPLRLGCVARLHPWKGQEVLIQAMALAREAVPVELTLFGDVYPGNDRVQHGLEQLVDSLGLKGVVRFAGFESDWTRIYPSIDVCVVPSTDPEPFSLAAIEAQACARPVIASRAGGPAEIILDGVTGILVEPRSPKAMAVAIVKLAQDPFLIQQLGAAGRTRVVKEFSEARFSSEIARTCSALLEPVSENDRLVI